MNESDIAPTSTDGSQPTHPLRDAARSPIVVLIILIGWLSWIHWPAEQIIAVLLILLPPASEMGAHA